MIWFAMALMFAQPTEAPEAPSDLQAMRLAATDWQACTIREAEPMALKTSELADTIVTAAMAFCWREEKQALVATDMYLETEHGTEGGAPDVLRAVKEAWRPKLIAAIIKMRSQEK